MAHKTNRTQQQPQFRSVSVDESDAYIPKLEEFVLSSTEKRLFKALQATSKLAKSQLQVVLHIYTHGCTGEDVWIPIPYNAFEKCCSGVLKNDRLKFLKQCGLIDCNGYYSIENHECLEYRPGYVLRPTLSRCRSRKNYIPSIECLIESM